MDEAALACARLVREGAVLRRELAELEHPDVRREVESRLAAVGLELATSVYSDHVGVRLSPEVASDPAFDAASNVGLHSDHCALLVVLWARLVLQKRAVADSRSVPGQAALLPNDRTDAAREFRPHVRLNALVREFGDVVGGRTRMKTLVSKLRQLKFLGGRGEVIEPGPFLELGIDGERMTEFIRRKVLSDLLAREDSKAEEVESPSDAEVQLLRALEALGGAAGIAELARATGEKRPRLRRLLQDLVQAGRVEQVGQRNATRYQLVEE